MSARKRFLRILATVGIGVAALVLFSTASNLIMGTVERSSISPYGETVSIDSGDVNVWVAGNGEETIVLLSGYGTAAPTLDFAPLTKQLQIHHTVVVVEHDLDVIRASDYLIDIGPLAGEKGGEVIFAGTRGLPVW